MSKLSRPIIPTDIWSRETKEMFARHLSTFDESQQLEIVQKLITFCITHHSPTADYGDYIYWLVTTWKVDVNAEPHVQFAVELNKYHCVRALILLGANISSRVPKRIYGSTLVPQVIREEPDLMVMEFNNRRWWPYTESLRLIVHYGGEKAVAYNNMAGAALTILNRLQRARSAVVAWLGVQRRLRYAHLHKGPVEMIGKLMWETRTSIVWVPTE
jgi:hypothetical protein